MGVKVRGRIEKRQLATILSKADEIIAKAEYKSGIGLHGRLGKALLEELFSRARVIQGDRPPPKTQIGPDTPTMVPGDSGDEDDYDAVTAVSFPGAQGAGNLSPGAERLSDTIVGSVLDRLDEVLGDKQRAKRVPRTERLEPFDLEEGVEPKAVPTLHQIHTFLHESTDGEAPARTFLEDLEMPDPDAIDGLSVASAIEKLIAESNEIEFEGYEEDLEKLMLETFEKFRTSPDSNLVVDPSAEEDILGDGGTLEERRAQRQASLRGGETDMGFVPPPSAIGFDALSHYLDPQSNPNAFDPGPTQAAYGLHRPYDPPIRPEVDPFELDPFSPTSAAPAQNAFPGSPGGQPDPFALDPFTGLPLPSGGQPLVQGPQPLGHPQEGFAPSWQPLPPDLGRPPGGVPFPGLPAAGGGFPMSDPYTPIQGQQAPGPFGEGPFLPAGFPSLDPQPPSPSQTGGFDPMDDPGSAARMPQGPPPAATPIYPVESGEYPQQSWGPAQLSSVQARERFEHQLEMIGASAMLERNNPPRGQAKSTPVKVIYDHDRHVFKSPLHPRMEAGDRFQLDDGRIYRVISSELVFIDGAACNQEAVCDQLGHMKAPLRRSWEG